MSYTPTRWENGKAPALSAENLNKIEDELVLLDEGFEEVNQALQTVQSDVSELKEADATINQTLQTVQNDVEYLKENGGGNGGNVPTKVSQLENDLGYVTSDEIDELKEADIAINQTLQTVQDDVEYLKENGGGGTGSSNDITETSKTTMPNSCEGRLLFKEIRGKTEQNGTPTPNNPQEIKSVAISEIRTHDGNGNESSFAFSQPIELNKIGDVQDVIVDGKPIRRITKKRITSSMAIASNPDWVNKQAFLIDNFFADGVQVYDAGFATVANIICSHAPTSSAVEIAGGVMNGVAQNLYDNLYFSFENCATLVELKTFLDSNVVYVYYELATPTDLPIADQVALNSIKTCDGTTYLEIDSPLEPEFIAEYGTSKVGGKTLEALATARNNEIRISALETSAVNNI